MEETKENIFPLDTKRTMGPSQDLNKISEIEKSIQNMKMHLSFLSKQEEVQEKKINVIYNNSLQVATNKINNISSHLFQKQRQGSKVKDCQMKKGMVKEMREKQISELRQTRLQISQLREKQTKELRQFSKNNDKKIKSLKQEEKIKNIQKADRVRNQQKEKKQKLALQKQQKHKQLEEKHIKENQMLQKKQNDMKEKLQKMRKEEQQIENRIERKKQIQRKMKQTMRGIAKMKEKQVVDIAQTCQDNNKMPRISRASEEYQIDSRIILQKALSKEKSLII